MYGRTIDDFEYRGIKFRWVISPNTLIYRVYREQELIGTIPVSQVRLRHSREAIKALYPICDKWLEQQEAGLRYAEQVKATILNAEPSMIFPIEDAEAVEDAELIPIIETARQEWLEGREERIARKTEEVRESFLAAERLLDRVEETAIDMTLHPELHSLTGIEDLIAVPQKEERKEPKRRGRPKRA